MPRFSKQRLDPVEPPYDAETAAALEALGPPIALFGVLARRPERARAVHGWGSYYLSRRSAMTLRQRELVIDRTTARCGAGYEFGVHVAVFAGKVGLDSAQVASLASGGPDDPCWEDPADRAVLRAVDALYDGDDLSDELWAELVRAVGEEGAIDLLLVCGWYHAVSYVARVLRLPDEPGTKGFATTIR
ncbi:carboxymuconolactone decarboxylase family protein [Nonomuraea sp. NPDC050556]|uniref:carboxymuconolactone decarboxylase family protein n=1 Tax=Nonomuraea sp. NPDC050556 TaxID=3364369 RepID=UPI0037A3FB54